MEHTSAGGEVGPGGGRAVVVMTDVAVTVIVGAGLFPGPLRSRCFNLVYSPAKRPMKTYRASSTSRTGYAAESNTALINSKTNATTRRSWVRGVKGSWATELRRSMNVGSAVLSVRYSSPSGSYSESRSKGAASEQVCQLEFDL